MKAKLVLACAMAGILLGAGSCASTRGGPQASVEVSYDDFMKLPQGEQQISREAQVPVDGVLTVTLGSNPTTGFEWSEQAQTGDQTILQQTDHKFVPPEATGIVGASGKEVWTFRALKKGTTTVAMEYSRPWEGGEKGEWKFNLTVTVK